VKALILAGGRGTRLRPYTLVLPKPLMPVGDYPILEIILLQLKRAGVDEVVLACGHMAQLFQAFFADGSRLGLPISYTFEDKPLGTAGSIGYSLNRLGDDFIVMNGDLLTTIDYRAMFDFHRASGSAATIGLHTREVAIDFGVVEMDDQSRLVRYREKPIYRFDVSMGVNVLSTAKVRRYIAAGQYLDMPDLMTQLVADGETVRGFRQDCFWLDIGRIDDYAQATEMFESRKREFLPDPE
jgi:NDP-sugar pyrophosphorylase family protein